MSQLARFTLQLQMHGTCLATGYLESILLEIYFVSLDAACSLLLAAEQALPLRLAWADALLADLSKVRIYSWKGSKLPANATFGSVWQLATWVCCIWALRTLAGRCLVLSSGCQAQALAMRRG